MEGEADSSGLLDWLERRLKPARGSAPKRATIAAAVALARDKRLAPLHLGLMGGAGTHATQLRDRILLEDLLTAAATDAAPFAATEVTPLYVVDVASAAGWLCPPLTTSLTSLPDNEDFCPVFRVPAPAPTPEDGYGSFDQLLVKPGWGFGITRLPSPSFGSGLSSSMAATLSVQGGALEHA